MHLARKLNLVLAAALLASAGAALAQLKPDLRAIANARHEGMEAIGKSMQAVGKEMRGGSPDAAVMRREAANIHRLALASRGWYPKGSGPELGIKTEATSNIWTDWSSFTARQREFITASAKFDQAARATDMAATGAAVKALGATCKGCHDSYKAKDD